MRKFLSILLFSFASIYLFAQLKLNGRLSIAVSFNAMEELTQAVVGNLSDTSLIIPEGMEVHEAEPTAKNLIFLSSADVLVYNGLGMEFYLAKTLAAVGNKNITLVEASKGIKAINIEEKAGHEHHNHGSFDPHSWLSPVSARLMVQNIEKTLSNIDKKNAKTYAKNATAYIKKLDMLIKEYKDKFAKLKNKTLVTSHAAFGYLCRDFGLHQVSIKNVFAEGEPNAKELVTLIEYCKKHSIKTIFSEENASDALSRTLASEVGAKVVKIYTMETKEDGLDYLARMRENLKRIYENLQ